MMMEGVRRVNPGINMVDLMDLTDTVTSILPGNALGFLDPFVQVGKFASCECLQSSVQYSKTFVSISIICKACGGKLMGWCGTSSGHWPFNDVVLVMSNGVVRGIIFLLDPNIEVE
jgi:hypothetical protein